MAINFIPNDPRAKAPAPGIRQQAKLANRPAARSGFTLTNGVAEGVAAPGTPQFLFWQCREAALAALRAWETSAGPHTKWQGNRKRLRLLQDEGVDVNAFYDRASFSFFHRAINGTTFFSGQSTDVVAHEIGHGLLDSVRPDFFDVNFLEVGAFHEAFGDCMAILTALRDADSCKRLLNGAANIRKRNFVESTAEDLSKAISLIDPNHNAALPRRAFNKLKYQLPSTLPSDGGPGELINEVHSFGMVFSGCFWDLIANLFAAGTQKDGPALAAAAKTAGTLLIAGAKAAVVTPRFLQSVGRAMVLADQSLHAGANRDLIRDAFARHDILLGSNAMMAPAMALSGAAPKGATLTAAVKKDVLARLGGPNGRRLETEGADIFGTHVVDALHTREVRLGNLHASLKGVVAMGHEPVRVGASGGRAAVMGAMPNAADTEGEVLSFVQSLLDHGKVAVVKAKTAGAVGSKAPGSSLPTHAIKTVGGKKVLRRVRFECFCCR